MSITTVVERAVQTKKPTLVFLDRTGSVDFVDHVPNVEDGERDIMIELQSMIGRPCFHICTILDGVIQDNDGDTVTVDSLSRLIKEAEDERARFYAEHPEEFGESAYPITK